MKTTIKITVTLADFLACEADEAERDFVCFVAATTEPHEREALRDDYALGLIDLTPEERTMTRAVRRSERGRDRVDVLRDLARGALEIA